MMHLYHLASARLFFIFALFIVFVSCRDYCDRLEIKVKRINNRNPPTYTLEASGMKFEQPVKVKTSEKGWNTKLG